MKWKFVGFCSRKLLAGRQRLLLTGAVVAAAAALTYTYFAVEYVLHAMVVGVADSTPHIRVFVPSGGSGSPGKLVHALSGINGVIRCDEGTVVEGDWHIVTRMIPENYDDRGEPHHAGIIPVQWTAYAFDNESYRPPTMLENVYSPGTRRQMEQRAADDPILVLDDMRERERRENWVIVNRHFSSLFPDSAGSFVDPFEVANPRTETDPVQCRIAGIIANSPFDIGLSGKRYMLYTRDNVIEKFVPSDERLAVVDLSLERRTDSEDLAKRIRGDHGLERVQTWQDVNGAALPFIGGIRLSTYSGMAAIAILAILGVAVAIVMTIEDRRRQLATLFAMGMNATELRLVFVVAGVRLVFMSSILGLLLAYCLARVSLPIWESVMENFFHPYRSALAYDIGALVCICLFMTVVAGTASWVASRSITTSDPVTYLR